VDKEVEALFERVEWEQGRLDVLVNNAWDGYDTAEDYGAPFWEQPLWRWDRQFTEGVRIHRTASRLAARLMVRQRSGLIVSTTFYDRGKYLGPPLSYDLQKTAVNRMAHGMAEELRGHNVAAVALSPGTPRNEFMIDPEQLLREYEIPPVVGAWPEGSFVQRTHSTQYVGRAVAALAADPGVIGRSGRVLLVGDVAREYGFTDIDGRYIPPYRIDED
jgi:NAD(P)-dependent dehydrogenase (short-subunit alcohol dehydrogenase family)